MVGVASHHFKKFSSRFAFPDGNAILLRGHDDEPSLVVVAFAPPDAATPGGVLYHAPCRSGTITTVGDFRLAAIIFKGGYWRNAWATPGCQPRRVIRASF